MSDDAKMNAEEKFELGSILFWYVFLPLAIILMSKFL